MLYLEQVPAPPLDSAVAMIWYVCAPAPAFRRERILPTGNIQIILNLARDFLWDCPDHAEARPTAPSLVVGARTGYEVVDTSDMADLIGIVFKPGGFTPFAGDKADRFSNASIHLDDIWGTRAGALRDRLREIAAPAGKIAAMERFLTRRFAGSLARNRCVDHALARFDQAAGIASVAEMAEDIGWSLRRFSQVFREQVGLSPKTWCRLRRFQQAIRQLHAGTEMRWAELALECGYYDQSHFANEFKAFSGVDATTYQARRGVWANHIPAD